MERRHYTMTWDDLKELYEACKPTPYMVVGGVPPTSPQENANRAWGALGRKMGFDPMTVKPAGGGDRHFTAEPVPAPAPEPAPTEEPAGIPTEADLAHQKVNELLARVEACAADPNAEPASRDLYGEIAATFRALGYGA